MHYCLNETQTKLKKWNDEKKSSSNKTTKWKLESSHSSHLRSRFVISCSEFKTAQAKMNQSHSQSKRRKRGKPSGEHRIKNKNKSTREKKINIQNRSWIDDEERNFKRKSTICTIHKWIVIWLCSDWCRLSTTLCIFTMNCYQTKMKFKIIIKKNNDWRRNKVEVKESTMTWSWCGVLNRRRRLWIVCCCYFLFISSRT